jgi:hypothetical protein
MRDAACSAQQLLAVCDLALVLGAYWYTIDSAVRAYTVDAMINALRQPMSRQLWLDSALVKVAQQKSH